MSPAPTGSWWRRNLVGLLLLVPAAALAAGAASSRLVEFPPQGDLGEEIASGSLGKPLGVDLGPVPLLDLPDRRFTLTVERVQPVEQVEGTLGREPAGAPADTTLWRLDVAFEADPSAPLDLCSYDVVDDAGREIGFSPTSIEAYLDRLDCVPPVGPGERPPSYDIALYTLLPRDRQPEVLRVWWAESDQDYLAVDLTP